MAYSGAVNVRRFGAKGDGVTDDTLRIINAYTNVGNLQVGDGTYVVSNATFDAPGSIQFDGGNFSVPVGAVNTYSCSVFVKASATAFSGVGTHRFNSPFQAPAWPIFSTTSTNLFLNNTRLRREILAEWWGARSDGGVQCWSALQKACDSLSEAGGIVQLLQGNYILTNTVTVGQGITLRGINQRSTVLRWTAATPGPIVQTSVSGVGDDQKFEDFTLENVGAAGVGIQINSVRVRLKHIFTSPTVAFSIAAICTRTNGVTYNVTLEHCDINSIGPGQQNPIGVWFHNGHTFIVDKCLLSGNRLSIKVGEAGLGSVTGFSLVNSRLESFSGQTPYPGSPNDIGLDIDQAYGITVSGNNWEMSSDEVSSTTNHLSIRLNNAYGGYISGCHFAGNGISKTSIQAVSSNAQSIVIQGNDFWRNDGYGIITTNGATLKIGKNYAPSPTLGVINPTNSSGWEQYLDLDASGRVLNSLTNITVGSNLTVAGSVRVTGNLNVTNKIYASDGDAAAPSISFDAQNNTGLYRSGSGKIGISYILAMPDGGSGSPSISFLNDGALGFYREATSQIGVSGGSLYLPNFLENIEIAAPAAPATNRARLYAEDSGANKTRLVVRFPSGAAHVIATEGSAIGGSGGIETNAGTGFNNTFTNATHVGVTKFDGSDQYYASNGVFALDASLGMQILKAGTAMYVGTPGLDSILLNVNDAAFTLNADDATTMIMYMGNDASLHTTDAAKGLLTVQNANLGFPALGTIKSGGYALGVFETNNAYTVTSNICAVIVDTTSGGVLITLPATAGVFDGQCFRIKNIGVNTVTITNSNGSDKIDGALSSTLTAQYQSVDVVRKGTNYWKF